MTVDVAANVAVNGAGKGNTAASQYSVTVRRPTVTIRKPTVGITGPADTQQGPFDVTITFSETVHRVRAG